MGNSVSWGLYFLWYDKAKHGISTYRGGGQGLSYYDYFLASGTAGTLCLSQKPVTFVVILKVHVVGLLTAICTNPIWVIKTRMLSTSAQHAGAYTSILDGIRRIYRADGLSGFYRGLVPSLFGVSHGALQFMAYEQLKKLRRTPSHNHQETSNLDTLVFSGLSKVFAGSITYPYQVIRARLQTYDAGIMYTSARDVVRKVLKREGVRGFYKGLGPNLLRVVPSNCVTFLVYENVRWFLSVVGGSG